VLELFKVHIHANQERRGNRTLRTELHLVCINCRKVEEQLNPTVFKASNFLAVALSLNHTISQFT